MATDPSPSVLPDACAARAPDPAGSYVSATLYPPTMAFLAVAVHFHGRRIAGLKTSFFRMQDDGSKGAALGDTVLTDQQGIARLQRLVTIGHYICEIQYQPAAMIPTVPRSQDTFALALPIGRHVAEFDDGKQFDRDDDIVDDDGSQADAADDPLPDASADAAGEPDPGSADSPDWSDAA
jgi:hypothetical protein